MAVMNFRINHLTERSGSAASRVVQYLTRQGEHAPQQSAGVVVGYLTRTSPATAEHADLVTQGHGNLPSWAHGDPGCFFAQAEQWERVGGPTRKGRWGTTWQMALPKELDQAAQKTMARAFLATYLARHPYLWVLHDPVNSHGDHEPHVHVLCNERVNDGKPREPYTYFRRPEVGGTAKDRWFHAHASTYELRAAWADWTNYTLERAGLSERIHPRSLRARDIDRKPEPKVGPGKNAALVAKREQIRQSRDVAREQALAATGWEARKMKLGITDVHAIEPREFLQAGYSRARNSQPGQWDPTAPSPQEQLDTKRARWAAKRQQEFRTLQQHTARLQGAQLRYDHYAATGRTPTGAMRVHTRELLNAGAALGLGDEEQAREKETAYGYDDRRRGHDWTE